jgi:hypothetical protein
MTTRKKKEATFERPAEDYPCQALNDVFSETYDLLMRKQADYGLSAFTPPLLNRGATAEDAILTRMSDKVARLKNILRTDGTQVADETIEDTIRDLAGYCFLFLANRKLIADGIDFKN